MSNLINEHFHLTLPTLLSESNITYVDTGILEIQGIVKVNDDSFIRPSVTNDMFLIPNVLKGVSFENIANAVMAKCVRHDYLNKISKFHISLRRPTFSTAGNNTIGYMYTGFDDLNEELKELKTILDQVHEEWKRFSWNDDIHKEFDTNDGYLVLLCLYIKYVCSIARSYGVYIDDEKNYEGFYNDQDHIYVRRKDFNDFLSWFFNRKMIMKYWTPEFISHNKKYVFETHKIYSSTTMFKIHKDLVIKIIEKYFSKEPGYIENGMPISEYIAKLLMVYLKS